MTTEEILMELCAAPGGSGNEQGAAQKALDLTGFPGGQLDALGNASVTFGDLSAQTHLLLEAHIDQIGLIVTHIEKKGFVRFAACGGVDARTLPGNPVTVWASGAKEPLMGVIGSVPPHLNKDGTDKVPDIADMAIDLGLPEEIVREQVHPGDRVFPFYTPRKLAGTRMTSAALDNRAGVATLVRCAHLLAKETLHCRITLLFATREEVGGQGARTGAFALEPDQAICVDVGFAAQPGVPEAESKPLGSGAMIGVAPVLDRTMTRRLAALAKQHEIPYTWDVMGNETGTDGDGIAGVRGGVRTALVSVPERYMHTAAEVVEMQDVEAVAQLLAAYGKELC